MEKPNVIQLFAIVDSLNTVAEFHRMFQHPILDHATIPDQQRQHLRYNLIGEELEEFRQACKDGDIVAIADALADLQYVLSGTILEFGLANQFKDILLEVHRSNMSKACKDQADADATVEHYRSTTGIDHHWEKRDGLYFVYRTADRKTVKSINYSPANIKGIIEASEAGGAIGIAEE